MKLAVVWVDAQRMTFLLTLLVLSGFVSCKMKAAATDERPTGSLGSVGRPEDERSPASNRDPMPSHLQDNLEDAKYGHLQQLNGDDYSNQNQQQQQLLRQQQQQFHRFVDKRYFDVLGGGEIPFIHKKKSFDSLGGGELPTFEDDEERRSLVDVLRGGKARGRWEGEAPPVEVRGRSFDDLGGGEIPWVEGRRK